MSIDWYVLKGVLIIIPHCFVSIITSGSKESFLERQHDYRSHSIQDYYSTFHIK